MPFAWKTLEQVMFVQLSEDRLACAFGAMLFAGLSIAAALYPLI